MKTWITCLGMSLSLTGGVLLWSPPPISAADTAFKPSVAVSEEVTDNIYEQAANKRVEYTTRVRPGATYR